MLLPIAAIIAGLILLVWSADRFVDGSAATARYFGMPSLLIGIIIVGFGTSAPEMVVSALAATAGNPGIALGNAYGSNITNIGLILGFTALISPIAVSSQVVRKELPILLAISAMAAWQIYDGELTRLDAIILLAVFALIMGTTIYQELKKKNHAPQDAQDTQDAQESSMSLPKAIMWLVLGLVLLIVSSRMLVWGAVEIAHALGISDLIIGLTIVAVGTSLPELASSIIAAIKNEHDIALGNIIGSNLFNTLAVVGIAGSIAPMEVSFEVLTRDVTVMCALTVALLIFALGKKGKARINRFEGALLLLSYIAYTVYLISTAFFATSH
ncbi:calcium/sodium antiporter [Anaerobiospirillum sp. NML120448]|uniref:calcium/sodium antiporter n=1 Tax=Anaerobiospirillum sp. NML120448 TaxID=2932816 RepID=UPI001FF273F7|nr:calcium/sodium antiporter [Anaerobiospirillum sp. NML120448]MCK0514238.1 calcium/sodium antiporter [Anaerobiospirillum sp. NML120448]